MDTLDLVLADDDVAEAAAVCDDEVRHEARATSNKPYGSGTETAGF